jgi:hypothetical protein
VAKTNHPCGLWGGSAIPKGQTSPSTPPRPPFFFFFPLTLEVGRTTHIRLPPDCLFEGGQNILVAHGSGCATHSQGPKHPNYPKGWLKHPKIFIYLFIFTKKKKSLEILKKKK